MAKISEIDKNFAVVSKIEKENISWLSSHSDCFTVKGVFFDGYCYRRMPGEIAEKVSSGVAYLNNHTSGGRILFETDSPYVALSTKGLTDNMPHMPFTGSKGFDLYLFENGEFVYYRTFTPTCEKTADFENIVEFGDSRKRKIMIHFPLYGGVSELNLGFDSDSSVEPFNPYKEGELFVYYGSSITQGGCASRPGNNFPAIVSRKTMSDFLCLGFSGNAHGEDEMIEYIANLPMSVFVMDYDHNDMGEPEKLAVRHPKLYNAVRAKHPDIPIIIMSAPWSKELEAMKKISRKVVFNTYENAKKNGDNVYFADGMNFFSGEYADCATVDGCHPNDYGFVRMAEAVLKVINENNLI
ncbi:MAG: SGNH/GDSL hydrolase family protein [Clostridia bacterium]|nr:SGNH/GDSL hydrolase family protein [Clostridia bacterium]